MGRAAALLLRLAIAVVLAATVVAGCGTAPGNIATGGPDAADATDRQGVAGSAAYIVEMTRNQQFEPAQIQVPAGTTVTWVNGDDALHTVTAGTDAPHPALAIIPEGAEPFGSGAVRRGAQFTHMFTVPGTYFYFCRYHHQEGMLGSVIVGGGP